MKRWALLPALAVAFAAAAGPPPLPDAVTRQLPDLKPLGDARLRVLAWHVYDASLWSAAAAFMPDAAHALDIRYAMDIRAADLAERSIEEMRKLGHRDPARLARWDREMRRVFPDIRAGDRLVGVHLPGREARFYNAQGLIGTVADAEFASAFFAIWLDERTSEPRMRRRLLGLGER